MGRPVGDGKYLSYMMVAPEGMKFPQHMLVHDKCVLQELDKESAPHMKGKIVARLLGLDHPNEELWRQYGWTLLARPYHRVGGLEFPEDHPLCQKPEVISPPDPGSDIPQTQLEAW